MHGKWNNLVKPYDFSFYWIIILAHQPFLLFFFHQSNLFIVNYYYTRIHVIFSSFISFTNYYKTIQYKIFMSYWNPSCHFSIETLSSRGIWKLEIMKRQVMLMNQKIMIIWLSQRLCWLSEHRLCWLFGIVQLIICFDIRLCWFSLILIGLC